MKELENKLKRKIGAFVILCLFLMVSIAYPVSAVDTLGEGDTKVEVVDTGDGTIIWEEDGDLWMTLDAGKFGMGDETPDAMLEIAETGTTPFMISNGESGDGDFLIMDTNGRLGLGDTTPDFHLEIDASSQDGYFGVTTASDGDIFIIDTNGDVGIGTNTPNQKLEVLDQDTQLRLAYDSSSYAEFTVSSIGVLTIQTTDTGGTTEDIELRTGNFNDAIYIVDADSRVGIGLSTPASKLTVAGEVTIGVSWASTQTAPTGGLLVEGKTGIGTTSPSAKFEVEVSTGGAAAIGGSTCSASGDQAVAINQGLASGSYSFATGVASAATGTGSMATGSLSTATDLYAVALGGSAAVASGEYSVAIGSEVTASGDHSIAIGNCLSGTDLNNNIRDSLMIGFNSDATVYVDGSSVGIKDTTPDALLDYDFTSTSTTAATEYGSYFLTSDTGVVTTGTDTTYGTYNEIIRTGSGEGGTTNVYGEFIDVTNDPAVGNTHNTYGEYIDLTTTSEGLHNAYGIYVNLDGNADTNYAGIFLGGNVGIGTASPGQLLQIGDDTNNLDGVMRFEASDGDEVDLGITTSDNFYITGGNVGIGTTSPLGGLTVDNTGESYGLGVSFDTSYVRTSDATVTTIATISTESGYAYGLTVTIVGKTAAGSNSAHYVRYLSYKNDGTLSAIGSVTSAHTAEDYSSWDVSFTTSGSDILVRVQGASGITIDWQSTVEMHIVGV